MKIEGAAIEKWYLRGKGDSNRIFAVRKTDLTVEPGRVTVLTGRSGSGKTTLLHMLSGLLTPSCGRVLADGEDLYEMNDKMLSQVRNRRFGMIPQGANVFPDLTVMENIVLPGGIYDPENPTERSDAVPELLDTLGISDLCNVLSKELSGGERRRVCMARALAGRPDVVFADEPTSDLDDENMQTVLRLLRNTADQGAAVLIVTHDRETLEFADTAFRISDKGTEPLF